MKSGKHSFYNLPDKRIRHRLRVHGAMLLAVLLMLCRFSAFSQTVEFTFLSANGNFCAPAQVKLLPAFSETPLAYYWQTGIADEESQELSPSVTYTVPGTYLVTLVVLFSDTLIEVSRPVSISGSPSVKITPDKSSLCQPGKVSFSLATTARLNNATWNFGDINVTPQSNGGQAVTHNFNDYGSFPVTVTAVDEKGCTGSDTYLYEIMRPAAVLSDTIIQGCLPVDVNFRAAVTVPQGSAVTAYEWDFNDGSPKVTGSLPEIRHTYLSADTFTATLTITTSEGCTNSFSFNPLAFGNPPAVPSLSVNKPVGCASEIMYFTASGTHADKFYWSFDDGTLFSSGLELPTKDSVLAYEFEAIGDFFVRVVAESNGCRSNVSDSVFVSIKGVVADFAFSNSCTERNRFNFRNTSDGTVNSIRWTFIDSSNVSGQQRPAFVFPQQGSFPVTMIVRENASGCADTITSTIYTALPKFLPADSFVCTGNNFTLALTDSYNSPRTTYTWTVGGRSYPQSASSNFSMALETPGLFTNRVIINNGTGYCRDTLFQPNILKVSGPTADFSAPSAICQSENFRLRGTGTTAFPSSPIVAYRWDLGNGLTASDQNPPAVRYGLPGNYTINLEVEDLDGCKSQISRKIRVNRLPLLRIVPRSQKVCQGQEVMLNALHKGSLRWSSPDANGCDTCGVIMVKPMAETRFLATTTDALGCVSRDSVVLDVWMPFEIPNGGMRDTSVCAGSSVQFDLKVSGKLINWLPEPGLSAYNISNPVAKPSASARYTAVVTDSGRCFTRTADALIEVNPIPVIDPGPDLILPYNAPFTIKPVYSTPIASYTWQPAGLLSCSNCPEPSGRATVSSLFTVNVVSSKGCKSSARIRLTLDCSENNLLMPTAFTPNNDGLNDYFYPLTRGVSNIRRFAIYNRLGELVFERKDFKPNDRSLGWNGMYKGKLQPVGSFVYFVEAECDLGNLLSTKGNLTLMR